MSRPERVHVVNGWWRAGRRGEMRRGRVGLRDGERVQRRVARDAAPLGDQLEVDGADEGCMVVQRRQSRVKLGDHRLEVRWRSLIRHAADEAAPVAPRAVGDAGGTIGLTNEEGGEANVPRARVEARVHVLDQYRARLKNFLGRQPRAVRVRDVDVEAARRARGNGHGPRELERRRLERRRRWVERPRRWPTQCARRQPAIPVVVG